MLSFRSEGFRSEDCARGGAARRFALAIYSSRATVSVSDNLLVVHALDSKVALIFDLRINQQFPITAPLPLATVSTDNFSSLYSPHWSFAPPDLVVDPQAGRVGQLHIDLYTIVSSSIDKACLLQFLLARTHCAEVGRALLLSPPPAPPSSPSCPSPRPTLPAFSHTALNSHARLATLGSPRR